MRIVRTFYTGKSGKKYEYSKYKNYEIPRYGYLPLPKWDYPYKIESKFVK